MTEPVRALIVDDEPLARDGLRIMLGGMADVDVVGEAGEGTTAVKAIRTLRPDVVLLDVQMPGQSGFDIVERAAPDHLPLVVFVTAYDEYALRAFQVHAFDYLLKPVSPERLADAMARVRADLLRGAPPRERVLDVVDTVRLGRARGPRAAAGTPCDSRCGIAIGTSWCVPPTSTGSMPPPTTSDSTRAAAASYCG